MAFLAVDVQGAAHIEEIREVRAEGRFLADGAIRVLHELFEVLLHIRPVVVIHPKMDPRLRTRRTLSGLAGLH